MKVENKNLLKKIFTSPLFLLSALLIFLFPTIIHFLFKLQGNNLTVSVWSVESILEYGSTIIGSLIVYFTVVLTLNKNNEENEKLIQSSHEINERLVQTTIEENKKLISNSHKEKKYESFAKSANEVLFQINEITNTLFEYNNTFSIESSFDIKKSLIDKMNTIFYALETNINQMRLFMPELARKYFTVRFFNVTYYNFKTNFGYVYFSKNFATLNQTSFIDMYVVNLTSYFPNFIIEINKILSLISDYYYEEAIFQQNEKNGNITFEADDYLKKYN